MALLTKRPRGARPTPRNRLAAASPNKPIGTAPSSYLVVPKSLSYWLNDVDGDCVTAEEAFAKACSGILISDATVKTWATQNGVLNGADLDQVLTAMTSKGFVQDGNTYDNGPATAVQWTEAANLQNAIWQGPVKIGVVGDPLERIVGTTNGWIGTGLAATKQSEEDHCVSLCGYGSISWLASCFNVSVPSSVNGANPAYALFTWDTIGIIDVPSLLNITWEAWLRTPTTVVNGTATPTPDSVQVFGAAPTPPTPPTPQPSGTTTFILSAPLSAGTYNVTPAN